MSVPDPPVGWAKVPNWLAQNPSVSPAAKVLYLALSSRTDVTGTCWPSQTRLAQDTGYGVTRIKEAITELRALGVLDVVVTRTRSGRRNHYILSGGGQPLERLTHQPLQRPITRTR